MAHPEWWPLKPLLLGRACAESDLCSVGKVKPYIGDVNPSHGLWAALEARSYKREIIFIGASSSMYYVTLVAQLVSNLEYLGFAHVLQLADKEESCRIYERLFSNIGCVWDSSPWIPWSMDRTWFLRAKMNARVPRLGYNTLMMDADSIVFQDPYRAFRAPGLRDTHFMCMAEGGRAGRSCYCNGGFARVQHVRPDGSTTWLFKEFIERAYRNMDDGYEMQSTHGMGGGPDSGPYALTFDQFALQDSMHSALARQPLYTNVMLIWSEAIGATKEQKAERRRYWEASMSAARCLNLAVRSSGHQLPQELTATLGPQSLDFDYWPMYVPDSGLDHNATAFGPMLVPRVPDSNFSSHFEKQLREDRPHCSWWPDVDGPRTQQHDASKELFAVPPEWLITNAWTRGTLGYWTAPPGFHAPQIIGHIHVLSVAAPDDATRIVKRGVQMHLGYSPQPIDWDLLRRIPVAVQAGSDTTHTHTRFLGYTAVWPRPRLILYNPHLSLAPLRTTRDYQLVAYGLAQLAALSGRTLAWPALDCGSPVLPTSHFHAWAAKSFHYLPPARNASYRAVAGRAHAAELQGMVGGPAGGAEPKVSGWAFPFFSQLTQRVQCFPLAGLCNGCIQTHPVNLTDGACPVPALLPNEVPHWLEAHGVASIRQGDQVAWLRGNVLEQPRHGTAAAIGAARGPALRRSAAETAAEMNPVQSHHASNSNTETTTAQAHPDFERRMALVDEADMHAFLDAHAHVPVIVVDAFVFVDATPPTSDPPSGASGGGDDAAEASRACMQEYTTLPLFWTDWEHDGKPKTPAVTLTAETTAKMTPATIHVAGSNARLVARGAGVQGKEWELIKRRVQAK